jgi:hypothetical protein
MLSIGMVDETPFAGGAENTILYYLIGYMGMSQAAKDVVKGTFLERHGNELKNLLPDTEQLIKEMAMPEEIKGKKISCEISEDNFISGFRKWKESTSTSPSGWHLGHYKAIVYNPDLKKQEPEKQHLCGKTYQCTSSLWVCTKTMVHVNYDYD